WLIAWALKKKMPRVLGKDLGTPSLCLPTKHRTCSRVRLSIFPRLQMSRHYAIHLPLTELIQRRLTLAKVGGSQLKVEQRQEQDTSQGTVYTLYWPAGTDPSQRPARSLPLPAPTALCPWRSGTGGPAARVRRREAAALRPIPGGRPPPASPRRCQAR